MNTKTKLIALLIFILLLVIGTTVQAAPTPRLPRPTPAATSNNTPTSTPLVTSTSPPRGTPAATPTTGNSPTPTQTATSGPSPTPTNTPSGSACPPQTVTLIGDVQGTGATSPKNGQTVFIEGIVVADFQETSEMQGFFVQDAGDGNPNSSDGIFVVSTKPVNLGDPVQVKGKVTESFSRTQLVNVKTVLICGSTSSIVPAAVSLPAANATELEKYEGMLVTLPQILYVTETYDLGRYGELSLASERLWQPTNITNPGPSAIALQAENDLKRIILDDGSTVQNPDPIEYPNPELTASNTIRSGDTVSGLTGVVDYAFSAYRIQPVSAPNWVHANPRTNNPVIGGSLKIGSFNVLNYFNGPAFPTSRGADTPAEFARQRDKIINAILSMNADILGLVELENDGYSSNSAIQDLINGLNASAPGGTTYAFINPGVSQVGTDEITVGIIYRVETVQPVGAAAIKTDGAFAVLNRPPIAQTFIQISTGGKITIAVNHFKSKGSACAGDPDTGDGQGNCNQTRVDAANALTAWLATDPTSSGDSDFIVLGDLNAYALEDPITAIKNAGYTNLIGTYEGTFAYSYVFFGQAGYLDHALATSSLTSQVVGAVQWHINADEPIVLDYNMEFKSNGQITSLYGPDPYRSSDHDPVLVGLNLTP